MAAPMQKIHFGFLLKINLKNESENNYEQYFKKRFIPILRRRRRAVFKENIQTAGAEIYSGFQKSKSMQISAVKAFLYAEAYASFK